MSRSCLAIVGPPASGKSTALRAQAEIHVPYAVYVSIGDAVRASEKGERAEDVAKQCLDSACASLKGNCVLLLDGLKRGSHVLSAMMVLERPSIRLAAVVELSSSYDLFRADRPLDAAELPARRERYNAERSRLLSTLEVETQVLSGSTAWDEAWKLTGVLSPRSDGIDWNQCGGPPPSPELPVLISEVGVLDKMTSSGRYVVSAKCDGVRAFIMFQNDVLWLIPVSLPRPALERPPPPSC